MSDDSLEALVKRDLPSKKKIAAVDYLTSMTFGLVAGFGLDYFKAGLRGVELAVNRSYSLLINAPIGIAFGWWREKMFDVFKTNEDHGRIRKFCVNLFAFNTMHANFYGLGVLLSTYCTNGEVDWYKISDGELGLMELSPLFTIGYSWYQDRIRGLFNIPSCAEKLYKQLKESKDSKP